MGSRRGFVVIKGHGDFKRRKSCRMTAFLKKLKYNLLTKFGMNYVIRRQYIARFGDINRLSLIIGDDATGFFDNDDGGSIIP